MFFYFPKKAVQIDMTTLEKNCSYPTGAMQSPPTEVPQPPPLGSNICSALWHALFHLWKGPFRQQHKIIFGEPQQLLSWGLGELLL